MKIWLDDERTPPDGWTWYRDAASLIKDLADEDFWYRIRHASLDHDLGTEATGTDVVNELVESVVVRGRQCPFQITVHSQNPVGRQRMQDTLRHHAIGQSDCIRVVDGILKTHRPHQCQGRHCVIHNPSHHTMLRWPLNWRGDRGMMERICPHGIGHPDPDHLDYITLIGGVHAGYDESVHGCDGCCHP